MSIVAMKNKMEAKRGLSGGGKGFSLNPKVKCTDINSATVKSARQARQNLVKRAACFSGSEGIQCERVWDGKRAPDCMGSGESMTQEEYIEKKRTDVASCKNVLLNFTNTTANLSTIIIEYNQDRGIYEIEYDGNKFQVDWNHTNSYIGSVISTIGAIEFNTTGQGKIQCLLPTSTMNIVNASSANKYVFNGETTYDADISFGLFNTNYTILNVPRSHPIALLNSSKINDISWNVDDSTPIIINVAGGSDETVVDDYFTFTDSTGESFTIGTDNNDSFKFMRNKTYRFVDNGINSRYGFVLGVDGVDSETLGPTYSDINNISNLDTTTSLVNIFVNGSNQQYRFNNDSTNLDISYGVTLGSYTLSNIPQENPLGIIGTSDISYSVDDSQAPIVITVTGGNTSANGAGDFYTFTVDGTEVNIGNGNFRFMRGRSYRFVEGVGGITSGNQFKIFINNTELTNKLGNSGSLPSDCLPSNIQLGSNYVTSYTSTSNKVFNGKYTFTSIPVSNPIAFLNKNVTGFDYNIDDSPTIVITVTGGTTTANGAGDFYTFTVDGTVVNIWNGNFKFMRGATYRFTNGGITDGHQMKIYANGGLSPGGLGNTATTSTPAGCLPEGDNTITTNGSNYELSAYNVFDGVYRFTNISQSNPITFLHNGVAGFNYNVYDGDGDIVITVTGGSIVPNAGGDYYTFTVGGTVVNIGNGDFKFMRGKTYRFVVGGGDIGGHPFKLYHNSVIVTASDGGDSISTVGEYITVNILPNHPFPVTSDMLYYQCGAHGSMKADLALSTLDVGGVVYDFFYGTIEVTIDSGFDGMANVGFRNLAGDITSGTNGLAYSSDCLVGGADGVSSIDITIGAGHGTAAGDLKYIHQDTGVADVDMSLSVLVIDTFDYDFYYGDVTVNVTGDFGSSVTFRSFNNDYTKSLSYSNTCDIVTSDGDNDITFRIPVDHSATAGDLKYIHQDTGVADVDMLLSVVNINNVNIDHFYGNINIDVTGDFGDASVRNFDGDFIDGENLITYGQSATTVFTGVSSFDYTFVSTAVNDIVYKKLKNENSNTVADAVAIKLLYKNSYDYYYGDLNLSVANNFGDVSVDCYYHGAMGGTNLFTYTETCDINLNGTADAIGPATLVVRSFSNTEPRTVELAKEDDQPVVLSFKNPEAFIFKPVGCDTLSTGSGLGGTAGADDRGYYGRGRCKVHYVNKSPQFQIKSYTGTGGYLDKLKRPNIDISFCG